MTGDLQLAFSRFSLQPSRVSLLPISAVFSQTTGRITVTFDGSLRPGPLNRDNWLLFVNPSRRHPISLAAAGIAVTSLTFPTLPSARSDVTYYGFIPDLYSHDGTPVAPFHAFPVTLSP